GQHPRARGGESVARGNGARECRLCNCCGPLRRVVPLAGGDFCAGRRSRSGGAQTVFCLHHLSAARARCTRGGSIACPMTVQDIPALNAALIGLATILMPFGFIHIQRALRTTDPVLKHKRITAHRTSMLLAGAVSAIFLVGYVTHKL